MRQFLLTAAGLLAYSMVTLDCGRGPKHLSEADYANGQAALEAIDKMDAALNDREQMVAWGELADTHSEKIGAHNLPLYSALLDYKVAIYRIDTALLKEHGARLSLEKAARLQSISTGVAATSELRAAEREEAQSRVIAKLCRDDLAQWFVDGVPATNMCRSKLASTRQ